MGSMRTKIYDARPGGAGKRSDVQHSEGIDQERPGVRVVVPVGASRAEVLEQLRSVMAAVARTHRSPVEAAIDRAAHALGYPCPRCGGQLRRREGRFGPFLGCTAFPRCDYTETLPADNVQEG